MITANEIRVRARRARTAFPGNAKALCNRLSDPANPPRPAAAAETLKYEVELITPLFGGGVTPGKNDLELPVRMKALRGQLRFWWRVLAAYGGLKDCGFGRPADGLALYAEETARWGGAGENGKPIPGRIGLRALNPHGFDNPVKFEQREVDTGKYGTAPQFREPTRAIDYALFSAKHGEQDGSPAKELIMPGASFTLAISVHANDAPPNASRIADELRHTLAWWATFGGIGARWRRGTGSVRVRDENNILLCVLDDFPTSDPSRPAWIYGMQLRTRSDCNVAKDAWAQAVWRLRAFRQDPKPGIGRHGSLKSSPKVFKQSYWPEPHLARHHHGPTVKWAHDTEARFFNGGAAGYVARGAFGLPLSIKFPPKFPSPPSSPVDSHGRGPQFGDRRPRRY